MEYQWTFGVVTDGTDPARADRCLSSIYSLKLLNSEVFLAGNCSSETFRQEYPSLQVLAMPELAAQNCWGAVRNRIVDASTGSIVVIVEDDMLLHLNFDSFNWSRKWSVLNNVVLNPDGSRFWDWARDTRVAVGAYSVPYKRFLIDYGEYASDVLVHRCRCIARRELFQKVRWDERSANPEEISILFSKRLRECKIDIETSRFSTMTHDDPRYRQEGLKVVKIQN